METRLRIFGEFTLAHIICTQKSTTFAATIWKLTFAHIFILSWTHCFTNGNFKIYMHYINFQIYSDLWTRMNKGLKHDLASLWILYWKPPYRRPCFPLLGTIFFGKSKFYFGMNNVYYKSYRYKCRKYCSLKVDHQLDPEKQFGSGYPCRPHFFRTNHRIYIYVDYIFKCYTQLKYAENSTTCALLRVPPK